MSFLAPWALVLGAAAAAAVVALHLLTTRRPPPLVLPTARFIPVSEARAVARASRPTDLLLLALRMLAVLLVAAAFARPVLDAAGPSVRTVVLVDVSRAVADPAAAAARARELAGEGGAVIAFDASAREVPGDSVAAMFAGPGRAARGTLSAAFVAARPAAARIARGADSVRLAIVSPLGAGTIDAATRGFREAWPGRIEIVRVAAAVDSARAPRPELVTTLDDDPIAPALDRLPAARGAHAVRVVRRAASAADTAWAREADRVLVVWPARADAPPTGEGVTTIGPAPATLVAPLARVPVPEGRVIARWRDAAPAAVEQSLGAGCARTVGVGIPVAGDLTLRAPFTHFLAAMVEPCGGRRGAALPDSVVAWIAGSGALAPARAVAASAAEDATRLPAWLLGAAIALLALELRVRSRDTREEGPAPRAAGRTA